ncbi:MAG: MFS transporter [Blastochloris sp.]|nr:MFS transporter [Blastochloris sp.]
MKDDEELIFEYKDPMPAGMTNAYWFQVFNSMSFSIVLGLPMLLYFRGLGASGTILGVLSSLTPLLTILQIPAARFVERTGYQKFVLRGWSLRSVFIVGMMAVPLLPGNMSNESRMMWMLFFLFCFNASRGFYSCGFLPWMSELVPESVRGRYVSTDQMCSLASIVGTSLLVALILGVADKNTGFSLVFGISFMAAVTGLFFLRKIPDVPVTGGSSSGQPVPWGAMLGYAPFRRFLVFNALLMVAWAGGGVISVPMVRDHFGLEDSKFMLLNAAWGVFFLLGAYLSRKTLDRVGSKPILHLALLLQLLHFAGWAVVSSRILPFNFWTITFQQATWGAGLCLVSSGQHPSGHGAGAEHGTEPFFCHIQREQQPGGGVISHFLGYQF